jgi:uncharacterized protein YcsI (UPF0317 family)
MLTNAQHSDFLEKDTATVRAAIRSGSYCGQTAGLAAGRLQANLVILPAEHARLFETYCLENPRPCPLVGKTDVGDPNWTALGDIDIRSDVPSYNVYRNGDLEARVTAISELWRDDLVAFALGCSFTFETALLRAGIPVPHIPANRTVPMYRTHIETTPAGPFRGGMVVSMRRIPQDKVALAQETTAKFPWAHGAPVHVGDPGALGIRDITQPEWGDPPLGDGVPVFWACGVTPQNALANAKLPFVVTHTPGHMLITDIEDTENAFIK